MPIVEQELSTLPEHLSSPLVASEVRDARSLVFCVVFCRSLVILLSFFLLAIVLSVLRFTDSDCPFGIFKLFCQQHRNGEIWTDIMKWSGGNHDYESVNTSLGRTQFIGVKLVVRSQVTTGRTQVNGVRLVVRSEVTTLTTRSSSLTHSSIIVFVTKQQINVCHNITYCISCIICIQFPGIRCKLYL